MFLLILEAWPKDGDKLVEVNGIYVNQENHKHVVQRIRKIPTEVTVLIIDNNCEKYRKEEEKLRLQIFFQMSFTFYLKRTRTGKNDNLAKNMQVISVILLVETIQTKFQKMLKNPRKS